MHPCKLKRWTIVRTLDLQHQLYIRYIRYPDAINPDLETKITYKSSLPWGCRVDITEAFAKLQCKFRVQGLALLYNGDGVSLYCSNATELTIGRCPATGHTRC
eukprot:3576426-Pyramimonas_sp.AAC.2